MSWFKIIKARRIYIVREFEWGKPNIHAEAKEKPGMMMIMASALNLTEGATEREVTLAIKEYVEEKTGWNVERFGYAITEI